MRRLLFFLAAICIVLGPVILVTGLLPITQGIYEPLVCPEGSKVGTQTTSSHYAMQGNVTTFDLICTYPNGQSVNVSHKLLFGFCGAPLIGVLLIVLATIGRGSQPIPVPPGAAPMPPAVVSAQPTPEGAGSSSLSDRLRELETAFNEGLLTQDEYEEQRKRLLDAM
jgi:hypothetical protein